MTGDANHEPTRWSLLAQLHGAEPNDSWDWFIRRYRGYVVAVLRRFGVRTHELDSATEDFWGYLYESRAVVRADRDGRFRNFLSGIVRNYGRRWQRLAAARTDSAVDPTSLADDDPNELDMWGAQLLHLGLERLAAEHGEHERVLRWFYGLPDEVGGAEAERLSATEIARRLGRTANAMHQMLFRARELLRECIVKEVAMTVVSSPELRDEADVFLRAIGRLRPGLVEFPGGGS